MPTEPGTSSRLTARGRRLMARQLLRHRNLAALGIGSGVVWALGRVAVPLVVSSAINRGIDRSSLGDLLVCAGLLLAIGSVSAVAAGLRRFSGEALGAHVEADLRAALFAQLQRLDIAFHDRTPVGQLLTRASTDLQQIRQPVVNFPLTVSNAVLLLASTGVLLWLDPVLAGLAIAPALAIIVVARSFMLRLGPAAADLEGALAAVSGSIQEALGGVRTVKGLGTEQREVDRVERETGQAMEAALAVTGLRAVYLPITDALPALGLVAVLCVGGLQVAHGSLGVGALVSFSYYVLMLVAPLRSIGMTVAQFQRAAVAAGLVADLLAAQATVADRRPAQPALRPKPVPPLELGRRGASRFSFDQVRFGYQTGPMVLDGFDLTVEPGETVAVSGPTGAGKSTVAALAARFYDVQGGRIRLDGVDIRDLPLAQLRQRVALLSSDAFLFQGTIADNIAFGRPGLGPDQIEAAAQAAGAHAFITSLPDGYATPVSARGSSLSGGQRQRIALARALATDPAVLILDEPLSAVDAEMERAIHATLRAVMRQRTCLLVAHRSSTLALADRVVTLAGGRTDLIGAR
jgi:ATP-binding cassette, subfamily B, bacterial